VVVSPRSPEETLEAWTKTVDILEALCPLADVLGLEPLLLALTDAADRADEELKRARDRVERPEGLQVPPAKMRGSGRCWHAPTLSTTLWRP
jgi:hypothetical protein